MSDVFEIVIEGNPPGLLMNDVYGSFVDSQMKREKDALTSQGTKARKEPANVARIQQLEWLLACYSKTIAGKMYPTIPHRLIRGGIHSGAKLTRDGQRVNRGIVVMSDIDFEYGEDTGKTLEELYEISEYKNQSVVTVQRAKLLKVRPCFPEWKCRFRVQIDETMVNAGALKSWIETCGKSIGIGDWRLDKGGEFGSFVIESFDAVE